MDLLQKEMQRKRQALAKAKMGGDGGPRKYMRNADIRRVEEEEEEEEQRQKLALAGKRARDAESEMNRHNQTRSDGTLSSAKKKIKKNKKQENDDGNDNASTKISNTSSSHDFDHSVGSVTKQLRELGLPIRFFGETHEQRTDRLREALEKQTTVLAGLS